MKPGVKLAFVVHAVKTGIERVVSDWQFAGANVPASVIAGNESDVKFGKLAMFMVAPNTMSSKESVVRL